MGGGGLGADARSSLDELMLSLAGVTRPRVCFVPTAAGDSDRVIAAFFEAFSTRDCEPSCLRLFGVPDRPVERLATADVIYVSGGNTANALAIWRVHGFDAILREAWGNGALLCGWSAGMICWFEASVTDSFGPTLAGMRDGLGFLPGSACPHYDGEGRRRPVYTSLVRDGFPPGIACDDAAAALYEGTSLVEIVAREPGARAYRVGAGGEEPLDARLL